MDSLSIGQARRIALAAQGFTDAAHNPPTLRTLSRTVARTGVLQVDSVNVLQRAHFMPLYSRMGPYDVDLLRRASSGRSQRRLVEYWAHVQALMPVELWPVMGHRMEQHRAQRGKWGPRDLPVEVVDGVLAEVRDRGPVTARDLDDGRPRSKDHWGWNWSQSRQALDLLFTFGDVAIVGRNAQFEVIYDVPERVLPAAVFEAPMLTKQDAEVELIRRAARSHGVGTTADLRDYYRIPLLADAQVAVDRLVETGELIPVQVESWKRPAYLHRDARRPRRVRARALLSPFDPVVWERARAEALFDFHYRIEIYTPRAKRIYGYYVLPFLLGERIVARVDLKADRAAQTLIVHSAHAEPHAPPETADELAAELRRLADWLGLAEIVVAPVGDLSGRLSVVCRSSSGRR